MQNPITLSGLAKALMGAGALLLVTFLQDVQAWGSDSTETWNWGKRLRTYTGRAAQGVLAGFSAATVGG